MTGSTTTPRGGARRCPLHRFDEDQADLERARQLLSAAREREVTDPRGAFELVHRAALRGAGILVARANRERRRKLPLNVWAALERMGPAERDRALSLVPLVAERMRLDRDPRAMPEPELLSRHLQDTAAHLEVVGEILLEDLPGSLTALAG